MGVCAAIPVTQKGKGYTVHPVSSSNTWASCQKIPPVGHTASVFMGGIPPPGVGWIASSGDHWVVFRPPAFSRECLQRLSLVVFWVVFRPPAWIGSPPAAITGWYSAPRREVDRLQQWSRVFWTASSGNHWVVYRPPACFPVGRHFWSSVTEAAPEGCRRMTTVNFYPPKKKG